MGRPRRYESAAQRQRAYRERQEAEWAQVDRRALEKMNGRLEQLQEAVRRAAAAGDETAQGCRAGSVETVLERLIRHFEGRAAAGRHGQEGEEA
jgi:molecular chaperone GrpE (heat shock protein)